MPDGGVPESASDAFGRPTGHMPASETHTSIHGQVVITRMWEARVVAGMLESALAWVSRELVPSALSQGAMSAEVCAADDPDVRIVVITRWLGDSAWGEPDAPPGLVSRSHAWPFRLVSMSRAADRPAS